MVESYTEGRVPARGSRDKMDYWIRGYMKDLTGYDRLRFTKEWIQRGKPPTREDFIKRCCEVMKIRYIPPNKSGVKTRESLLQR